MENLNIADFHKAIGNLSREDEITFRQYFIGALSASCPATFWLSALKHAQICLEKYKQQEAK